VFWPFEKVPEDASPANPLVNLTNARNAMGKHYARLEESTRFSKILNDDNEGLGINPLTGQ
jgi:hypothetical protein